MGSQQKLAAALNCSRTQVNHWTKTPAKAAAVSIPPLRCIAIEALTGISREELNPAFDWRLFRTVPSKPRRTAKTVEAI